jgi:hypothetical protein
MKYINKLKIINLKRANEQIAFHFIQTQDRGFMLTPAIWLGKAYALGIQIEWLKWTIGIGIIQRG